MLEHYFPVLIFIIFGVIFGCVPMLIGKIVSPSKPTPEKLAAYECGFDAFDEARMPFDVRFYLVAILFIVFDLEIAFLIPWAVIIHQVSLVGFIGMLFFLALLVAGFIYEWCRGALEWE